MILKASVVFAALCRWAELYGSDTVCSCCDSNCSSAASNGESSLKRFFVFKKKKKKVCFLLELNDWILKHFHLFQRLK